MKSHQAQRNAVSFFVGALFAVGLAVSGMTQPKKIIAFLDPAAWDPSLLFVMLGAVGVHLVLYPLIRRRGSPLLDTQWHVPTRQDITPRLMIGSALFGIGWGLGGFCPGPALTSLVSGEVRTLVFVGTMILGMLLFRKTSPYLKLRE
jgi:uncharacterized membrane protein YedE/YeeE